MIRPSVFASCTYPYQVRIQSLGDKGPIFLDNFKEMASRSIRNVFLGCKAGRRLGGLYLKRAEREFHTG